MATPTYGELRGESERLGEDNDCTVKAVAVVAGVPYATAHAALAARGRLPGWRCSRSMYHRALADLGFEVTDVDARDLGARDSLGSGLGATSVERALRKHMPGRKVLVNFRAHVAAFDGHTLVDWSQGRRLRVVSVYVVTPMPSAPHTRRRGAVAAVWALCEELHLKGTLTRKALLERAAAAGLNHNTAATQYAAWQKAHGS